MVVTPPSQHPFSWNRQTKWDKVGWSPIRMTSFRPGRLSSQHQEGNGNVKLAIPVRLEVRL